MDEARKALVKIGGIWLCEGYYDVVEQQNTAVINNIVAYCTSIYILYTNF
jgi:hypothetical protein